MGELEDIRRCQGETDLSRTASKQVIEAHSREGQRERTFPLQRDGMAAKEGVVSSLGCQDTGGTCHLRRCDACERARKGVWAVSRSTGHVN